MVTFSSRGNFENIDRWLGRMSRREIFSALDGYARQGVDALAAATPTATGETAASWDYEIHKTFGTYSIRWTNSHVDDQGTPIAILLEVGHGTGTGGYVEGIDYIMPAIRPIFDAIAESVWREVTSL